MSARAETQVAERLYYWQPGLLEFAAKVTAIREMARVDGKQVWQIALDRTAFYPTSGGQPFDTGVLIATSRSGASLTVPITSVDEDDAGEVWHTTAKPLQEGTAVQGVVDRERRQDHMQQHSGQHLLSAVLYRDLQARTVSFHLGADVSTIDVEGAVLDDASLLSIEESVNDAVAESLPVSVRSVSREQAEGMLASGLLRKLPPRTGDIRLVDIARLDWNACGGTHVSSTAAIGPLLLRGMERVRDTVRISFLCGSRAQRAAHADFRQLEALAKALSTSREQLPVSIGRLQAENRAAAKERTLLLEALADAQASLLAAAAAQAGSAYILHTLNPLQAGCNAGYARLLASRLVNSTPLRAALVAAPEGERCSVALAASAGSLDCGHLLRTKLAEFKGRGGGNREMAQGSLGHSHFAAFLAEIKAVLSA